KVLLVLEIKVEGAARDAGARDYIRDIGAVITLTGEDPFGMPQYLRPPRLFFHSQIRASRTIGVGRRSQTAGARRSTGLLPLESRRTPLDTQAKPGLERRFRRADRER